MIVNAGVQSARHTRLIFLPVSRIPRRKFKESPWKIECILFGNKTYQLLTKKDFIMFNTNTVVNCGPNSNITGGNFSQITAGDYSRVTGGHDSTVRGRDYCTIIGGNHSTLTGEDNSTLIGGDYSTITGGSDSTVRGGKGSILILKYWDGKRFRVIVGYVGEDGIEANFPYRVVNGKLVAKSITTG